MNFSINTFQLLYVCIFLFELFTCKKRCMQKNKIILIILFLLMALCLVMDKNIFTFINNFFSFVFIIIFVHIFSNK